MRPIVWSYGGGTQSVAIAVLISQGKLPQPERIVMADTGRESSATWDYLETVVAPLLDTMGLRVEIIAPRRDGYSTSDQQGKPLIPAWANDGGQLRTFCSGKWKRDPIYRWLREPERGYGPKNPIVQWIGFSLDEIHRCRPERRKWASLHWPLIMGYGITKTRKECIALVVAAGLPTPPRSACWMCPYMNNREWREQRDNRPNDHAAAIAFEQKMIEADARGGLFLHKSRVPLGQADLRDADAPDHPLFGRGETCESGLCWT